MKRIIFSILLSVIPSIVSAQAGPSSKLIFDQGGPSLAVVQGYVFKYYPDGSSNGTVLNGVTCTGTSAPYTCTANFPAFTPGQHTLTMTASVTAGESVKSPPFSFAFVVIPVAPSNIRIGE